MNWSALDARVAKSLLRVMRRPHDVIDSVAETIEVVGRRELRRRVTVRLHATAASGDRWTYLDVLQPDKGAMTGLQVVDSNADATIASHVEHQNVSSLIIRRRLLSVWKSAIVPQGQQARFHTAMSAAYGALTALPVQGEEAAVAAVDAHFDRASSMLKAALIPGVVLSARKMHYLFQLCTRLEKRYLLLVKLRPTADLAPWVTFTHHSDISEFHVRSRGFQRPRQSRWLVGHAGTPSSFRLHVPWAKRAAHYQLELEAPEDHFLAQQVLLLARRRRGEPQGLRLVPPDSELRWAINTSRGRRSHIFLSQAHREQLAVFAGIQALELPGRSTTRALLLAAFTSLTLLGFTLFAEFARGALMETAALVVAFVAVGAFVATPSAGTGVLGHPVLSRFTPGALALLCGAFIFWLASLSGSISPEVRAVLDPQALDLARTARDYAGWVLTALASGLTLRLILRRGALIRHFTRANEDTVVVSKNFS